MGNFVRRTGPKSGSGTGTSTQKPQPRPQSPSSNLKPGNPNVVVSPKSGEETKFERRLPTMAELRAAQAARKAATAGGASKKEAEYQAVKAGVGVSKGTVKDPKIAADAKRKAELEAIRAKAKADTMSRMGGRNRARMEEVDIFDTIKEYLIGEGATEEEALKQMLTLTDEQRTEILEAEVFRNRRPFSDAGEYPMRDAMRDAGMNNAPNAPVVPVKKAKKKPTTQMAGYEPEGELVDEGSCGSKKKRPSKKKGY